MSVFCKVCPTLFGAVVFGSFVAICLTFVATVRVDGVLVLSFNKCTTANAYAVGLAIVLACSNGYGSADEMTKSGVATRFVFQLRLVLFQLCFVLCRGTVVWARAKCKALFFFVGRQKPS